MRIAMTATMPWTMAVHRIVSWPVVVMASVGGISKRGSLALKVVTTAIPWLKMLA